MNTQNKKTTGPPQNQRLETLREIRSREEKSGAGLLGRSRFISLLRVLVFLAFLGGIWLVLGPNHWPWFSLVPVGLAFFGLLFLHEGLHRRLLGNRFRLALLEWSFARLDNRWQGQGIPGTGLLPADHPYANDLDIVGPGSVFESICLARTRSGQEILAQWLGYPGNLEEVLIRQGACAELSHQLDTRLDLVEKTGGMQPGQSLASAKSWAESANTGPGLPWVIGGLVLGIANLASLIRWISGTSDSLEMAGCSLLTLILYGLTWKSIRKATKGLDRQAEALLSARGGIHALAQAGTWENSRLKTLQEKVRSLPGKKSACGALDGLVNLVQTWHARKNPLITVPLVLLFWDLHFAWLLSQWRKKHGGSLGAWLDALAEYEALQSISHHAFLFPDDVFPVLTQSGHPSFVAKDLGHPLLPLAQCVRNNVDLNPPRQMLLVSGSNMSGKSTYLRSVGVGAVLSWAGAPVRATAMEIGRFQVAAVLHAEDSLRLGMSRFAAELARMRRLLELSKGQIPLLFLLDEIFSGTNSSDRLAGAEALIIRLVRSGAIGMVTTHDLTLARIAEDLGEKGANVHFVDTWTGGTMTFDYRLQPGVVPRSNALGLMRAIGLEI